MDVSSAPSGKEIVMKVSEVMTPGCECTHPDASLQEVAEKMRSRDIGPLPVCDNDRIVGVVTDRDVTVRGTAEGRDPKTARVRDVMSPGVVWCFDDDDVEEASRKMKEKQIRRLVVLNHDKRAVGVVSLGDLAVQTGDRHLAGSTVQAVSQPG